LDSRRPCVSVAPSRPWPALRRHPLRHVAIAARSTDCEATRRGERVDQRRRGEPSLLRDAHAPPLIGVGARRRGAGCASGPRPAPRAFPDAFQSPFRQEGPTGRRTARPESSTPCRLRHDPWPSSTLGGCDVSDMTRVRQVITPNPAREAAGRLGSGIELRWRRSPVSSSPCPPVPGRYPHAATTPTK
jgi:hypothetical protein